MEPVINITGGAVFNVSSTRPQTQTIPVTPFLKQTYLDVPDSLLVFNTAVFEELRGMQDVLGTELFDRIQKHCKELESFVKSDYNTELVTKLAAQIAACAAAAVFHYGGDLKLPNG